MDTQPIQTVLQDNKTTLQTVVQEGITINSVVQDVPQIQTVLQDNSPAISSVINAPFVEVTSVNGMTGDVLTEPIAQAFQTNHYYIQNTLVRYGSGLYYSKNTFTSGSAFDADDWEKLEGSGASTWEEIENKPTFAQIAFSGSYTDLTDKPSINDGALTIKRNNETIVTFSANSDTPTEANILVPTKTSDITNDSNYVVSTDLATVATTGKYKDLIDRNCWFGTGTVTYEDPVTPEPVIVIPPTAEVTTPDMQIEVFEITTTTGDFDFKNGSSIRAFMDSTNETYSGITYIKVDGSDKYRLYSTTDTKAVDIDIEANSWRKGEMIDIVCYDNNLYLVEAGLASTTYAGVTKLSSLVSSTSTNYAATSSAVRQAYWHGAWYGTCGTGATTAAKTVTCSYFSSAGGLQAGAHLTVKFTYANTVASPTLNVNSTGTKAIYIGSSVAGAGAWQAGDVKEFVYDGTNWVMTSSSLQAYPVGSVFTSVSHTTATAVRNALGGGTWVAWGAGRVPVGMGSNGTTNYTTVEATGGAETHYHTPGTSLTACIGSPTGNASAIGFAAVNSAGDNSTYSVGGNSSQASGHPGRSHNTKLTGQTQNASSMQPYITVYMWKRTA